MGDRSAITPDRHAGGGWVNHGEKTRPITVMEIMETSAQIDHGTWETANNSSAINNPAGS